MAHFAKLDADNNVLEVIVINNSDIDNLPFPESEPVGVAFCQSLFGTDTIWKQTSYNSNFRGQYAAVGGFYYPANDVFVPPKPYPSWTFNTTTANWDPPVPVPVPPYGYLPIWDEQDQQWYFRLDPTKV